MLRWLAIAVLVFSTSADAQVFKPGKSTPTGSSGSSSSAKKSSTSSKKSSAKKSARKTSAKKKKDAPAVDPDYVKIIDDDDE